MPLVYARGLILALSLWALAVPNSGISETRTLECEFEKYHEPDSWLLQNTSEFVLVFTYDTVTGDAFMQGNAGVSPVQVHQGRWGMTFAEQLSTGAVQTTTVDLNGDAVHSRNTLVFGEVVPSQYYGNCQ